MADFSGRLSRAPVVYALCDIRFAPILKMASLVPDIQERLRATHDGFEEERMAGFVVAGAAPPNMQTELRWRFEDADQRSGYILLNGAFIYHTTAYSDFDEFVVEVLRGFTAVSEVAKIPRVLRIGLRYVDLIVDDGDTPADQFVHPQLRGFGSELPDISENMSGYLFDGATKVGRLVLRVHRGQHKIPLPPDLLPISLNLPRPPPGDRSSIFLDTDHFVERPKTSLADLEQLLLDLKAPISAVFKKAVTQKAVSAWK